MFLLFGLRVNLVPLGGACYDLKINIGVRSDGAESPLPFRGPFGLRDESACPPIADSRAITLRPVEQSLGQTNAGARQNETEAGPAGPCRGHVKELRPFLCGLPD